MTVKTLFKNFATSLRATWPRTLGTRQQKLDARNNDKLLRHFSDVGQRAAATAYVKYNAAGLAKPKNAAKAAGRAAIAQAAKSISQQAVKVGEAERKHIRAKYAVKLAQLKCRQIRRQYGEFSVEASQSLKVLASVSALEKQASQEFMAAQIRF